MNHLPYFHIKKSWNLPYDWGKSLRRKVKEKSILIFTWRILEGIRRADNRSEVHTLLELLKLIHKFSQFSLAFLSL